MSGAMRCPILTTSLLFLALMSVASSWRSYDQTCTCLPTHWEGKMASKRRTLDLTTGEWLVSENVWTVHYEYRRHRLAAMLNRRSDTKIIADSSKVRQRLICVRVVVFAPKVKLKWRVPAPLPRIGNTMQCNAMQCNAMQCNAMQCNAMQCNAMQCNAMQCNAMQCNAMQCNAMQCNAMQCNAMQCNAMQCNAMQCNAMQCNAMQCNAMQCNAMQCNAMQCNAMQCNAMQCNAMQCNAMQCNAMQCNAMQCNAMQYNNL